MHVSLVSYGSGGQGPAAGACICMRMLQSTVASFATLIPTASASIFIFMWILLARTLRPVPVPCARVRRPIDIRIMMHICAEPHGHGQSSRVHVRVWMDREGEH